MSSTRAGPFRRRQRPMWPNGRVNAVRLGRGALRPSDLYFGLRSASWLRLLGGICIFYIASNALFALAFLACGDVITNARPGSFADAFFFSVETMSTIGYGTMAPLGTAAHLLMTAEALFGLLLTATVTGLVFSKFSTPTARILFSRHAVVGRHDGTPMLMLRIGNERANQIVEAQIRVSLARDEITSDGEHIRRFHDLPLLRSSTPLFQLTWTVYHPLLETSPLYGATPEKLTAANASVLVTVMGLDDALMQTVHARHAYNADDIAWHARFVDILHFDDEGRRIIDYARFHEVMPLEPPPVS